MKKLAVLGLLISLVGCGKPLGSGASGAKPTRYWIEQLKSKDEEKRNEAMRVLVEGAKAEAARQEKTVIEDLIDALKSPDKQERKGAAEVLGRLGNFYADEAGDALVAMLRDPDEEIARAAARALARVDPDKAAKAGVPRGIK